MAETSMPWDGTSYTEANWREFAEFYAGTGVLEGVLGGLIVFGDSSGLQVKVPTGKAYVKGHYYSNTAEKIVAVGTRHATLDRIDLVTLKADFTANTILALVKAGTPASSPVAPALQQDASVWEIEIARITVRDAAEAGGSSVAIAASEVSVANRPLIGAGNGVVTGGITTAHLAALAVTNAKINDVAATKITGTVTDAQLATGISGSKITGTVPDATTIAGVALAALGRLATAAVWTAKQTFGNANGTWLNIAGTVSWDIITLLSGGLQRLQLFPNGSGLFEIRNSANTHTPFAVRVDAPGTDYVLLAAMNGDPGAGALDNANVTFFLDQTNNQLKCRVKYADGTNKTGTVCTLA